MPTRSDIKVILNTPTIQKNLNVSIPVFPTTAQVINVSEVNDLISHQNQNQINEYFSQRFQDIDIEQGQQLAFISTLTADVTTEQLLNQAVNQNNAIYPGNFWIVQIPKFDQITVTNVQKNPDFDLRNEDGNLIPNNQAVVFKNKDWLIYTNKKEFQKIDLNSAADYNVTIHSALSNAVGALTQQDVNILLDKAITKNTIKAINNEPDADSNGEYNHLWFQIIDKN